MRIDPNDFAQKYYDALLKQKTTQDESSVEVPVATPKPYVPNTRKPEILKVTDEHPMNRIDTLPKIDEWIEVTNGTLSGEIAKISRVDEGLGMVYARVAQCSIRSILLADQINGIDKAMPQEISMQTVQDWLNHTDSVQSFRTYPVHRQNFTCVSSQRAIDHKSKVPQTTAPWSLGFVVRYIVPGESNAALSKAKYIILRLFSDGWVLMCRKKYWKPEDKENAALFAKILIDQDMSTEMQFVADVEDDDSAIPKANNSCFPEITGFVLAHSSILRPTIGKVGEEVAVLQENLNCAQKTALKKIISLRKETTNSVPLVATIISKNNTTDEVGIRPIDHVKTETDIQITLCTSDVCSFMKL